jgi:hypothetical protein
LRYYAIVTLDTIRRSVVAGAAAACSLAIAAPARAEAPLPVHADVRVGWAVDADAFTRAIANRYHVTLKRVVAADIDRDGDLDFIAATDAGLRVWVNDGAGRLTAQPPQQGLPLAGIGHSTEWNGGDARRDPPAQNETPSPYAQYGAAHAPPATAAAPATSIQIERPSNVLFGVRVPRAPPR